VITPTGRLISMILANGKGKPCTSIIPERNDRLLHIDGIKRTESDGQPPLFPFRGTAGIKVTDRSHC